MEKLQKLGGVAALFEGAIYLFAFIFFGLWWHFPADLDAKQQFAFLTDNQSLLSIVNFTMYVLFGILLAVLVLALHERLKSNNRILSQMAAIFGVIWVALVIASGMISNIGLAAALDLSAQSLEQAMILWATIGAVVEGIGGGNEVVGGLWVLLLSIAALKGKELQSALCYLGVFVGVVGIFTIYPADVFTELFGVSQLVWFCWLGVFLLSSGKNQ